MFKINADAVQKLAAVEVGTDSNFSALKVLHEQKIRLFVFSLCALVLFQQGHDVGAVIELPNVIACTETVGTIEFQYITAMLLS